MELKGNPELALPPDRAAPGPVRVLLVEDNPGDARLFRELVRETGTNAFEIENATRLADGCARVEKGGIGLVLLDLSLPDSQGLETFQRMHRCAPELPVIVLSGLSNEAVAVQAVHDGAQDYLVKGVGDGQLLVRAMQYAIERSRAARQVARYAEELRRKNLQMEADLAMARELQLSFLPQQYPVFPPDARPEQSLLRFAHRYLPAASVSGDFFAVLPLGDQAAGIFICDVMGHGLRAALLTAVLRGVMEELKPVALDPPRFLSGVNRSFHSILRRTEETILATGLYLVVDVQGREVRMASGGHPSPLRLDRAAGTVGALRERSGPQGPALGLFGDAVYLETRVDFLPGDMLLLFTDGLCEATSAEGEEFGVARLQEVVRSQWQRPAGELFDSVLAAVQGFSGTTTFEDDVCLVSVEFAGRPVAEPR